jgi:hypothetical protein
MDAVNLMGIWPTFPDPTPTRIRYAVEIYHRLLEDAVVENRRTRRKETAKERHRRIFDQMVARITQEDEDDQIVLLAV